MIENFKTGDPLGGLPFRQKLNELVTVCNAVLRAAGDGLVRVSHTESGLTIGLNIQGVLSRVPKAGWVPVGGIIMWSGAVVDIKSNWALCDGGEYCIEHGIKDHGHAGTVTTPDLQGRFIMGLDEDDAGGDGDEDAIGDTGGYRWHGIAENNHPDHLDHVHWKQTALIRGTTGTDWYVSGEVYTAIQTNPPSGEGGLVQRHGGILHGWSGGEDPEVHSNDDTDNRPRYYVLAFIQRIR